MSTETPTEQRRVILNGCCEDFILDYHDVRRIIRGFFCPCCQTGWQKTSPKVYLRLKDNDYFSFHDIGTFPQLIPTSPSAYLLTKRCCVKLISKYGPGMQSHVICPHCDAHWQPVRVRSDLEQTLMANVRHGGRDALAPTLFIRDDRMLYTLRKTALGYDLWFETDQGIAEVLIK
jgi:hypothetical protein